MTDLKFYERGSVYRQRGISLIELMIGLVVGLLVVAVASGTLVVSRKVAGTVSDVSEIQQQGTYIMRLLGQQIRQAGELRLVLYIDDISPVSAAREDSFKPVGLLDEAKRFEPEISGGLYGVKEEVDNQPILGFVNADDALAGTLHRQNEERMWMANCMGIDTRGGPILSRFLLSGTDLKCNDGSGSSDQPIAGNVADFKTLYSIEEKGQDGKFKAIKYRKSTGMSDNDWRKVRSVEVCMTLFGSEPIEMSDDASYMDCDGKKVEYKNIPDVELRKRMHMTFRNVFQLRSKGMHSA